MINSRLRVAIFKSNVHQYEIAEKLGVSRFTLQRWLQTEISKAKQDEIMNALKELEKEKS